MSERKVLNKYYPPDFDASKLPRVKREKNRQFTIRLMAPFNMRCKTCGEYIYRGKKFNARKEDVIGKTYLGIQIYRFYIKCTKCLAEITFLTDPENQDYEMENGAIRNFESLRLAEKQAEAEAKQAKDEEVNNPMKVLENRTRDSKREMDILETLEDLREQNAANASIDPKILLEEEDRLRREIELREIEEDEMEIKRLFGKTASKDEFNEVVVNDLASKAEVVEKKHKINNDEEEEEAFNSNSKKLKPDPPAVFIKPSQVQVQKTQQDKLKSNSLMFIKKKPLVVKSEPTESNEAQASGSNGNSKPAVNNLANFMSAYDCSSDEEDESG